MKDTPEVPVAQLAAIAAGVVTVAIAVKGVSVAVRLALEELDYRAGDLESWFRRVT